MLPLNRFPFSRAVRVAAFVTVVAIGVTGCATSEYKYTTKIAGGERLTFRMVNGRVDNAKVDGLEGRMPIFFPDKEQKKIRYVFGLVAATPIALRNVRVEDVSEEQPVLIMEDTEPQLKDLSWTGQSAWFGSDDPAIKWVNYLGESFRVYRLTITTGDGRTVILHEGSVTPSFSKMMMRRLLGKDY